ncbi:MAG: hypothetical protein AAF389_14645 [Gemmatimonadota bacterium]
MHASTSLRRITSVVMVGAALIWSAGCGGGTKPPPAPGEARGVPPDLRGTRVIVLPVQQNLGVPGDVDAEVAFALRSKTEDIEWVWEEEVQRILQRSPAIQAQTRGLPVGSFLVAEVDRVGDPLFGQLRRMSGLVDGGAVLLPVQASLGPAGDVEGAAPRVRLHAALIEPRTGRVVWYGVEEGGDFPAEDPRALASAVEALAQSLLWYVRD